MTLDSGCLLALALGGGLFVELTGAQVAATVAELGASGPGDMGKVMGAVKAKLAGKADMGLVSAAVKKALAP